MKEDTDRKITVEDLLRLKRAERPAAEFWATFEAELRTKQLSAIVSKRPWWVRYAGLFTIAARYQVSVGAAAAIAMAFVGYHYLDSQPVVSGAAPQAAIPLVPVAAAAHAAPAPERSAVFVSEASPRIQATLESARESVPAPLPVVKATASHVTQAPVEVASDSLSKSPFEDGIAIKLADFREPVSDYSRPSVFGSDREFEEPSAAARQPVSEPLARMDPAAERRARLLAPALPAFSSRSATSVENDWIRQRSSPDDRMYESMDRGSSEDHMLVGFRF